MTDDGHTLSSRLVHEGDASVLVGHLSYLLHTAWTFVVTSSRHTLPARVVHILCIFSGWAPFACLHQITKDGLSLSAVFLGDMHVSLGSGHDQLHCWSSWTQNALLAPLVGIFLRWTDRLYHTD